MTMRKQFSTMPTDNVPPSFLKAKKSLGQHFLIHPRIAQRIAHIPSLTSNSVVLEIGPGRGILTRELLTRSGKVIAVETDHKLVELLQSSFHNDIASGRLELIEEDIRLLDLSLLPQGYQVVANIPYYLTGELFRRFLEHSNQPSAMTLLVQKEVAERIARSKKESILSLSVKAYGTPRYEFTVPRGAFKPPPSVDSAVLTIGDISRARFTSLAEEELFFKLLHAGFAHKRKFLSNNLASAHLSVSSVPDKVRAEDLSLEAWISYAHESAH
jgi:16S rRNA (adenine1518-N6/adenine1519-N6)-dimethyltransferase